MDEAIMRIVSDESGKLIFNSQGGVCLCDNNDHNASERDIESRQDERAGSEQVANARFDHNASERDIESRQDERAGSEQVANARFDHNASERDIESRQDERAGSEQVASARFDENRAHWTRRKILKLISAYKEHKLLFRSNTIKNSEAWRRVAEDVPDMSPKQCEAKFKYLKCLYTKKKDNMGNNSSGARAITFEYFYELDEIFHEEPNIVPVATASSSSIAEETPTQQPTVEVAIESSIVRSPADLEPNTSASARAPRRKRTRLEIQLEKFQAREKRMERFLEQQEACTKRICDMMQKFIDKL